MADSGGHGHGDDERKLETREVCCCCRLGCVCWCRVECLTLCVLAGVSHSSVHSGRQQRRHCVVQACPCGHSTLSTQVCPKVREASGGQERPGQHSRVRFCATRGEPRRVSAFDAVNRCMNECIYVCLCVCVCVLGYPREERKNRRLRVTHEER